jgi:cell division transport system permease protein
VSKAWFFITEALGSLRRNYFMTAAALVTVFLSMLVLGIVLVFASTINLVLRDVERKVEVTVFIKDGVTAAQTGALQKEIAGWSEVKTATYVSKDQALARFKQDMKAHPEIWQSLDTNPLPASIEISLKDPAQATAVANRLQDRPQIDEVRYGRQTAERLLSVTSAIRNAFVVFIILLGVVAVLLISNTIRLSIFARRQAVEIMKLVGATNWFIRWPFVIEGMTVGLVGAVAALVLVAVGADFLLGRLQGSLLFVTVPIQTIPLMQLTLALLCSGVVIGAIGSAVGLRRFLDV